MLGQGRPSRNTRYETEQQQAVHGSGQIKSKQFNIRFRTRLLLVPAERQQECSSKTELMQQRPCSERQDCALDMLTAKREYNLRTHRLLLFIYINIYILLLKRLDFSVVFQVWSGNR